MKQKLHKLSDLPHYQTCDDMQCPYWTAQLTCDRLARGECEFKVLHLLKTDSEKQNQRVDGFRHGEWQVKYNSLGSINRASYRLGRSHGSSVTFWSNGRVRYYSEYKEGKLHGEYRTHYRNGHLKSEGRFREGKKHGPFKDYNEKGKRTYNKYFQDDKEVDIISGTF